ncbi:MAG: hypothetical protein A4S12_03755 [Proteobacteria bacterium SG_bin5]|nr:hypothetical protein [Sphingomonas sp.]OQW43974.1 MAG: hypothetical protein A4S12_03755 [Proteobacteria bacterium SG_bin5]
MFYRVLLVPLALGLLASPAAAAVDQRGERQEVFSQMRAGRLLPLREIERRVVPSMGGAQYLGFDFDPGSGIYTLKFLRNGNVIWVEVDGHTGTILGRSGN